MELVQQLKEQLIEQLCLEDLTVEDIDTDAALFGNESIGLDSIDALEINVLLEKEYGIKVETPAQGKEIMYSIQTMADYITKHQQ